MDEDLRLKPARRQEISESVQDLSLFGPSSSASDLLSASHDCIVVHDQHGVVQFLNPAAERLFGWTSSEMRGQTLHTVLKTQFPKSFCDLEQELLAQGRWEGDLTHTTRDGHLLVVHSRWLLQSQAPRHGRILRLERDLTEQAQLRSALDLAYRSLEQAAGQRLAELETANEALLESQERFVQIGKAMPDVVWLTNLRRTTTIYVSPAYEQIWGRTCQSLYDHPHSWLEGVHPEDRPRLRRFFAKRASDQGYQQSYRIVRPDCSVRAVLDSGFPVRDNTGSCYRVVGIVRDVTEQKELEKEILAISEREQRRIGQDLHDDLCQQLVGIEFLSRALQERLGTNPQSAKAEEIAKLIRQSINYTRQLARGLAPVELAENGLLRGLQTLAARASDLFQIQCSVHSPETVIVRDPTVSAHLYRIAQEALSNSVKHGHASRIQIGLALQSDAGQLTILDNGKGLPTEAHVSSGMGLRIMRYRADVIGAVLLMEIPPAGGTLITCTFPLTPW